MPRSGDVLHVTRAASVQFIVSPILFRVISLPDWETWPGWVWLDGYELDARGLAVERRSIWVQPAGLIRVPDAPDPRSRTARRRAARNAGPAVTKATVPRPRTSPETTPRTAGRTR